MTTLISKSVVTKKVYNAIGNIKAVDYLNDYVASYVDIDSVEIVEVDVLDSKNTFASFTMTASGKSTIECVSNSVLTELKKLLKAKDVQVSVTISADKKINMNLNVFYNGNKK